MPYPNEHSARLKSPDDFDPKSFRRTAGGTIYGKIKVPATIGIIWGKLKGKTKPSDPVMPQALRFPTKNWTVEAARKWLNDNNVKPISFEPASEEHKKSLNQTENIPKAALRFKEEEEPVEILSLKEGEKPSKRKFSMVAHSGRVMLNHWLWGNLAIDLSGVSIGRKKKPALREHNSNRIVGWTEGINIDEKRGIVAEGIFSEKTEDGRQALELADEGFPWQASIYIPPLVIERVKDGETAEVNGQKLKGPGTIFRKSVLREVSFCALGADENTSASALKDKGDNIDLDVEIIENQKEEVENMELTDLTLEMLKTERSDLAEALLEEGRESGSKENLDAVVKKERERVLAILKEAKGFEGMGDVANEAIEKGDSVEVAVGKFKDKRLAELEKNAPSNLGPDGDDSGKGAKSHLDKAKAYQQEHGGSMTEALKATAEKTVKK
jgi:hypothetical protein